MRSDVPGSDHCPIVLTLYTADERRDDEIKIPPYPETTVPAGYKAPFKPTTIDEDDKNDEDQPIKLTQKKRQSTDNDIDETVKPKKRGRPKRVEVEKEVKKKVQEEILDDEEEEDYQPPRKLLAFNIIPDSDNNNQNKRGRKPGRKPKVVKEEKEEEVEEEKEKENTEEKVVRRGPGRPKGSPNKFKKAKIIKELLALKEAGIQLRKPGRKPGESHSHKPGPKPKSSKKQGPKPNNQSANSTPKKSISIHVSPYVLTSVNGRQVDVQKSLELVDLLDYQTKFTIPGDKIAKPPVILFNSETNEIIIPQIKPVEQKKRRRHHHIRASYERMSLAKYASISKNPPISSSESSSESSESEDEDVPIQRNKNDKETEVKEKKKPGRKPGRKPGPKPKNEIPEENKETEVKQKKKPGRKPKNPKPEEKKPEENKTEGKKVEENNNEDDDEDDENKAIKINQKKKPGRPGRKPKVQQENDEKENEKDKKIKKKTGRKPKNSKPENEKIENNNSVFIEKDIQKNDSELSEDSNKNESNNEGTAQDKNNTNDTLHRRKGRPKRIIVSEEEMISSPIKVINNENNS